jgi:hypothetical protein
VYKRTKVPVGDWVGALVGETVGETVVGAKVGGWVGDLVVGETVGDFVVGTAVGVAVPWMQAQMKKRTLLHANTPELIHAEVRNADEPVVPNETGLAVVQSEHDAIEDPDQ